VVRRKLAATLIAITVAQLLLLITLLNGEYRDQVLVAVSSR